MHTRPREPSSIAGFGLEWLFDGLSRLRTTLKSVDFEAKVNKKNRNDATYLVREVCLFRGAHSVIYCLPKAGSNGNPYMKLPSTYCSESLPWELIHIFYGFIECLTLRLKIVHYGHHS